MSCRDRFVIRREESEKMDDNVTMAVDVSEGIEFSRGHVETSRTRRVVESVRDCPA